MIYLVPISIVASLTAVMHPPQQRVPAVVQALVGEFEEAYKRRDLGTLNSPGNKIKLTITHSLKEKTEVRVFRSFRGMELWLRRRETEGLPEREVLGTSRFEKNRIIYEFDGINHNHLYLDSLEISLSSSKPFITHVVLQDGD